MTSLFFLMPTVVINDKRAGEKQKKTNRLPGKTAAPARM